jgi:predicted phosphodiesterase
MTRTAIISDIHANLEALTAVLKDIDKQKVDRIVCLGDIVGYGANPRECIDAVRKNCALVLEGNHEEAVISKDNDLSFFTVDAAASIRWTRANLLSYPDYNELWEYLKSLPTWHSEGFKGEAAEKDKIGNIAYAHGSPRDTINEYLSSWDVSNLNIDSPTLPEAKKEEYAKDPGKFAAQKAFSLQKLIESFSMINKVCFNGHNHNPFVIMQLGTKYEDLSQIKEVNKSGIFYRVPTIKLSGERKVKIFEINEGYAYTFPDHLKDDKYILGEEKVVINAGSVGQPRDTDKRACYIIYDDNYKSVQWRRVDYDVRKAAAMILLNDAIPKEVALRLFGRLLDGL